MAVALVTGAAGFLGSHVCEALLAGGHRVIGLDDLSGGCRENLPTGMTCAHTDILDHAGLRQMFETQRPDWVFHLAAYAAESRSHHVRRHVYSSIVVGSANLVNEAVRAKCRHFTLVSSIAVMGEGMEVPFNEGMWPSPIDPYGVAKLAAEMDVRAAGAHFGLPWTVFRPHNVYGERQSMSDPDRNVVAIFMRQVLEGRPITVVGDGSQRRQFTYVGDVAPLIASCPSTPGTQGRTFFVGTDVSHGVGILAMEVKRAMGTTDHPVVTIPPRKEAWSACANHSTARQVFGEILQTPLREGLARTAAWARSLMSAGTLPPMRQSLPSEIE